MIILASTSVTRQRLLRAADVPFQAIAADIDEVALTTNLAAKGESPRAIAEALAEAKAIKISLLHQGALVLGSDTVLRYGVDRMLDKPKNRDDVAQHLRLLSGKDHELISAAAIAQNGEILWRATEAPQLRMRILSEDFINDYVAKVGDEVQGSVGAYHLEGLGAQLFAHISGDYFSILGLPLLAVLDYLRARQVLPS